MLHQSLLILLAFLNGSWMLLTGCTLCLNQRFPILRKPGIWTKIFDFFKVDPKKLGPVFIGLGLSWLMAAFGLIMQTLWAADMIIFLSVISLWYFPFGTATSLSCLFLVQMLAFAVAA